MILRRYKEKKKEPAIGKPVLNKREIASKNKSVKSVDLKEPVLKKKQG